MRAFPGCGQVVRMEREVVRKGTGEVENRSFWVRDVLFREDACQVRGVGAQVLAALRAFLVSPAPPPGGQGEEGGLGGLLLQPPRCPALPGALCGIAVKSGVEL
jgi:hypothetical protein